MANRYRPVQRDQPFLMPPDMREWLPGDHLAWFIIDAVESLDLSGFAVRPWGPGRAAYDPRVMLGLLFYGYATGARSVRKIETGCRSDVAFRVICAQDVPDHSTIGRFRRNHFADPDAIAGLFGQVLAIAARAGLGRLGLIGLDGTKIAANASKDANRSRDTLGELAAAIVAEADEADAAEDALFGEARGDELPEEMADPVTRRARILRAAADLAAEEQEARAADEDLARAFRERRDKGERTGPAPKGQAGKLTAETADAVLARYQAKYDDWHARNAESLARTGKPLRGFKPVPPGQHSRVRRARARSRAAAERDAQAGPRRDAPRTRANTTDPDSRLMPVRGGTFIQGYNAQAACTADGLCVAALVTTDTTDYASYQPLTTAITTAAATLQAAAPTTIHARLARPGILLADAGYLSDDNLTADLPEGAARLIATGNRRAAATGTLAPQATTPAAQAMTQTLATEPARSHYKTRSPIAEGPFGDHKHNLGFRRFHLRGLTRVTSEWTFQNTARNLRKIHAATT